jgi:hypothetical protein
MAKFSLFLLTLVIVAAGNGEHGGAVAYAIHENGDLQQRRETMAEAVRIFSNPVSAAAADAQTVRRLAMFMKRELAPLAPVFSAIRKMPVNSAADVRSWEEAFDAAFELLMRHFQPIWPPQQGYPKTDDL